jgi:hypothetical protein
MTMFLAKPPEKRRFLTMERERHADGDRRELIELTLTAGTR